MTLERGALLNNRYRIVDILGQGGMASIYRAIDENLGVEVAVKENLFTTEEYARQFRQEAVILATLRHPNLPRVTDHFVIEQQGQYLVMDYIEGEDLRQRIDRAGVLSEEEAIKVGVAICDALIYLHSCQPRVLHRDIKPGNVKVTPQGQVFLVDFGLAKVVQLGAITDTGARAMTPGYSPPEQYGTARTDSRSDIYSLGATLYSALTNTLPEDGMARAMDQVRLTPIRQHNPKISRRLEMVLEKALEVLPDSRYQTAEDFRRELLNSRSTSRRKMPLDLILTPPPMNDLYADEEVGAYKQDEPVLVDNGGEADPEFPLPVSTPLPYPSRGSKPSSRPAQSRRPTWISGVVIIVLITILGMSFTLYRNPSFLAQVGLGQNIELTETQIALAAAPKDTPIPIVGLSHNSSTSTPSPTSVPLSSPTPAPISSTLSPVMTNQTETATSTPEATPLGGGRGQIGFASNRNGNPQIYMQDVDSGIVRQITHVTDGACQPSWSPDGMRLVFVSPCTKEQDIYAGSSLWLINVDGSELTRLPTEPGGDFDPTWSPDGNHIAFTSLRSDGREKVMRINLQNQVVDLLAGVGAFNSQPAWSPDGKFLAFITTRNGPYQIWIENSNGTDPHLFSRSGELRNFFPTWSPDGKVILFTQFKQDGTGLPGLYHSALDAEDTRGVRVSQDISMPMRDACYSPDGQWIAFETWQAGEDHNIFMMTASGTQIQPLVQDSAYDFDPAFRPSIP